MAFKATLTIEDKTFHLLECESILEQKTDKKGKPISEVRGGRIFFVVLGSEDDFLPSWATDKKKRHDGTITMYQWDQETKFKEISFKNAYIVRFSESYMLDPDSGTNIIGDMSLTNEGQKYLYDRSIKIHNQFQTSYLFSMTISAEEISINGLDHNNRW